jgi:hypothetical protein
MTRLIRCRLRVLCLFSTVLILTGCGPRELRKPDLYPVHGRLLWKGEPVRYALLTLEPVDPTGALGADGKTDEEGTFTLRTLSNDEQPDGVAPGQYRLRVEPYDGLTYGALPTGATPTAFPTGPLVVDNPVIEIRAEDNELNIDIP